MISEVVEVPDNQVGLITLFLRDASRFVFLIRHIRRIHG